MWWEREGTAPCPLIGSHWPPGLEEVTILLIVAISKLIHQSSRATASLKALRYQDWLVSFLIYQ